MQSSKIDVVWNDSFVVYMYNPKCPSIRNVPDLPFEDYATKFLLLDMSILDVALEKSNYSNVGFYEK